MKLKKYLAYSASAGSGKTYALNIRYISLLFLGESPSSILATTFTNKSANEMKNRIINSLRNFKNETDDFIQEISSQTGLSKYELFEKYDDVLKKFLKSKNFIITLDSFFTGILRSTSLHLKIEPNFAIENLDFKVKESIFLDEVDKNSLLHGLVDLITQMNDKNFNNIFNIMESFYKIEPLLPEINYENSSLIEIENKIFNMQNDIKKLLISVKATNRTIKMFDNSIISKLISKKLFQYESLSEHSWFKKYVEKNPEIDNIYEEIKENLTQWIKIRESLILNNIFKFFKFYKNTNISFSQNKNILTFDDSNYFTYNLLHKSINKDFLYFKIDTNFNHILLDEFQDISILQFLLLQPIIEELVFGNGDESFKTFFYVGDIKQSLYRFRGSKRELFHSVAKQYNIDIVNMNINYRSDKNIVNQVNIWFEKLIKEYTPQQYRNNKNEGYLQVVETHTDNLINKMVQQVKYLLKNGVNINSIALIVFTNKDGLLLKEECYRNNIDTVLKTRSSLKYILEIAKIIKMIEFLLFDNKIDSSGILFDMDLKLEDIDLSWFNPFMEPVNLINMIINIFNYFNGDLNILKLLDFASKYHNILTFLEDFKISNIEVASNTNLGATIITIHSSKGLEYENVILMDRIKRESYDKSKILYKYDNSIYIKKLYLKMSNRTHFNEEGYLELIEKEKELIKKDNHNVLYVAFTRGIHSLTIIKKNENSAFDDLNIYTMTLGKLEPSKYTKYGEEKKSKPIKIESYNKQNISTESNKKIDRKKVIFGIVLHFTLEMMNKFNLNSLKLALEISKNKYGLELNNSQFLDINSRITKLIENIEFQNLLKNAKIYKEQSLSFQGKIKKIDLLLEYENSILVIDYKSSQSLKNKYIEQINNYINAIFTIKKKKTTGKIIYLLKDKILINQV